MLFIISTGQNRPNILEDKKDEQYHLNWARYCAGKSNNFLQSDWIAKTIVNKKFYKNDQWFFEEDLEAFFKDDTGQDRNRLKMGLNFIRPMVEQYRGNATSMDIKYAAKSISPQAISRREEALSKQLFLTNVANQAGNPFAQKLKQDNPIGDSEAETIQTFNNLYTDKLVEKINYLINWVSEYNHFKEKQKRLSQNMVLSGLGVMYEQEYGGNQIFDVVESERFFWDRTARRYDLSDAEYQGMVDWMLPSQIYENYPNIDNDQRLQIEKFASQFYNGVIQNNVSQYGGFNQDMGGRVPVIKCFWKDGQRDEYGYVKDQYGYPYLTKINYIYEGESEPRYTDKDLIKVNTERAKKVLDGKLSKKLYYDVLRMAIFVPKEVLMSSSSGEGGASDILLDWGIKPYQETESLDFANVKFPFKVNCWGYMDGQVMSPIDDCINPQRFLNRLMSVAENQINNAGGAGLIYDSTMLNQDGGEGELVRNVAQSKPVGIEARGRGIQNAVGHYDSSLKAGTTVLFNIIDIMKKHIQDITGVNEALQGQSTGSDQLVGVTEQLIQRGSIIQEPFYDAIENIFDQCYNSISSVGKRIYADNERELTIATGDEGAQVIKITKDMKTEDFRVFVKREMSTPALTKSANDMLMMFYQLRLIDDKRFAALYNRSTPDQVSAAIRAYAVEKEEAAKAQAKIDEQTAQLQAAEIIKEQAAAKYDKFQEQAREDVNAEENRKSAERQTMIKALAKPAPAKNNAK